MESNFGFDGNFLLITLLSIYIGNNLSLSFSMCSYIFDGILVAFWKQIMNVFSISWASDNLPTLEAFSLLEILVLVDEQIGFRFVS